MDIPVKFLMKLIPLLPLSAAGELSRMIDADRRRSGGRVCKFRAKGNVTVTGKDVTVTGNVTVTEKKCNGYISGTAEISPKTQFSAENSVRVGGVGGGVHTAFDVPGYNSINQSTENFGKKEKNNFFEKNNPEKRAAWEDLEKRALPYWKAMPRDSRIKSSFKEFALVFRKLRKGDDVPELWMFLGVAKTLLAGEYKPQAHKFLDGEPWKALPAKTLDAIRRQRDILEREAARAIAAFDGEKEAK